MLLQQCNNKQCNKIKEKLSDVETVSRKQIENTHRD